MNVWQLIAVGVVLLLGVFGVLVPGIPGPLVVWAGLLWWATTERTGLAWTVLMAATAVLLLSEVLTWLLPARSLRDAGTPYRTLVWAGVAGIAGFFLIPVIGCPLGAVGGLYVLERARLGSHGDAWAATRTVLRAIGLSVLVELFACLLVVGAWTGAVVAG
ncbi:DUF456 domain-containing protein [Streptomyces sp. RS10V-4]|uniref:DUF456 domain-containing protein n=1 Tax=Streptomyces rhizoryzae TaxID=2932493 RepID=UPI002003066E|nr:DUF456 domain-containing protein [Streptomyces rhizoryzae]MCK7625500.1 DUF456 domain-containing protein [Streptomyces rhizoryzae]